MAQKALRSFAFAFTWRFSTQMELGIVSSVFVTRPEQSCSSKTSLLLRCHTGPIVFYACCDDRRSYATSTEGLVPSGGRRSSDYVMPDSDSAVARRNPHTGGYFWRRGDCALRSVGTFPPSRVGPSSTQDHAGARSFHDFRGDRRHVHSYCGRCVARPARSTDPYVCLGRGHWGSSPSFRLA